MLDTGLPEAGYNKPAGNSAPEMVPKKIMFYPSGFFFATI